MERRSEVRIPYDESVQVTILRDAPRTHAGRSRNMSGRGLCIWMAEPVPVSTPVAVEWRNAVLVGEVCHCSPDVDGFTMGLRLNEVLNMTSQLFNLGSALRTASAVPSSTTPELRRS